MDKVQTIEDFYRARLDWLPENLKKGIGHFNVFLMSSCSGIKAGVVPYSRKDYYKISLLKGPHRIHYADRTIVSGHYALMFSNPMIPYNFERLSEDQSGVFCIFTEDFFSQYGAIREYPIYKPGNTLVYILSEAQMNEAESIFSKMFEELNTDYVYKYDVIRGLVFNLIHLAMKMQPADAEYLSASTGMTRIASLFSELLERQFPIESPTQRMRLHTPGDFSGQLSIHVNHLNRSLKEVTGKTTSRLIAERISQEARALLKHTDWSISEIAWCLGFDELSHFIRFFRKIFKQSPKNFRKGLIV